ncbi:MAG TPA: class I SAM-dependent methyltransferase [Clostridia bacterium]|nr:class I SAM-dependent methyltransferase [Clostridia bacterium]
MKKSQEEKKYRHPVKTIFISQLLKEIVRVIRKSKAKTVIDIGCGEGYPDKVICAQLPKIKLVGVDIDPQVLKKAKEQNPSVEYCREDIFKLNFKSAEFDLGLVLEVLEHLKEPEKAVGEVKRVTKKALFSVPFEPWFSLASLASASYLKTKGKHPDHVNFWNPSNFEQLLRKHYNKVRIRRIFPWLIAFCEDEK